VGTGRKPRGRPCVVYLRLCFRGGFQSSMSTIISIGPIYRTALTIINERPRGNHPGPTAHLIDVTAGPFARQIVANSFSQKLPALAAVTWLRRAMMRQAVIAGYRETGCRRCPPFHLAQIRSLYWLEENRTEAQAKNRSSRSHSRC
jgi:hypothetical protein